MNEEIEVKVNEKKLERFLLSILGDCENASNGLTKYCYDLEDSSDCYRYIDKITKKVENFCKQCNLSYENYEDYIDEELKESVEKLREEY